MTKADVERFQAILLSLKSRLSGGVSRLAHEALGASEGATAGPAADVADQGAENYEQEFAFNLLQNQEQTLQQIDEALARIEQGTFGRCEECSTAIPKARLEAVPYARHCVNCARKLQ